MIYYCNNPTRDNQIGSKIKFKKPIDNQPNLINFESNTIKGKRHLANYYRHPQKKKKLPHITSIK